MLTNSRESLLWAELLYDTLFANSVKRDEDEDDMITSGDESFAPSHHLPCLDIGARISQKWKN